MLSICILRTTAAHWSPPIMLAQGIALKDSDLSKGLP